MRNWKGKHKGFTLVELLIVIVIIGILAAGMMLASGSAQESAEASNMVSGLRSAKAAGLLWLADNVGMDPASLTLTWDAGTATFGATPTNAARKAISDAMDNKEMAKRLMIYRDSGNPVKYWIGMVGKSTNIATKALGQGGKDSGVFSDDRAVGGGANGSNLWILVR